MNYTKLDAAQQKAILDQRLAGYESEHYQHTLNKDLLVSSGATDAKTKAEIANAEAAIKTLDKAHAEVLKRLAALPK